MATNSSTTEQLTPPVTANWGKDFMASIVVFLVALPLCLGIAVASGVPPALGLISGIIGGLVVGYFTGAPFQASGPAAGLVSIVFEIVQAQGLEALGMIVLLAGLIQIAAGYFNLSPVFRAVSPAVVHGMLSGIGVVIVASQLHVMVDDTPQSKAIENIIALPEAFMKAIQDSPDTAHHLAAALGLCSLGIILLWQYVPKRLKAIPGALVAIAVAVFLSEWFQLPIKYVSIPDELTSTISLPSLQSLQLLWNDQIWIAALTIAFVATAETMLSTTALEKLHSGPRANFDKELMAQGIGNTLAGFLGALPITGVIVRSTANIESGATSKVSTMLHGLWILLFVLFLSHFLEKIPVTSLAAVLVYTGYKLIKLQVVKQMWGISRTKVIIYFITLLGVVFTNLLEGVVLGFVLSSFRLLYHLSKLKATVETDPETRRYTLNFFGSATFMSLPILSSQLEMIPPGWNVVIHAEGLYYVDLACMEHLKGFESRYACTEEGTIEVHWGGTTTRGVCHTQVKA